MVALRDPFSCK